MGVKIAWAEKVSSLKKKKKERNKKHLKLKESGSFVYFFDDLLNKLNCLRGNSIQN